MEIDKCYKPTPSPKKLVGKCLLAHQWAQENTGLFWRQIAMQSRDWLLYVYCLGTVGKVMYQRHCLILHFKGK